MKSIQHRTCIRINTVGNRWCRPLREGHWRPQMASSKVAICPGECWPFFRSILLSPSCWRHVFQRRTFQSCRSTGVPPEQSICCSVFPRVIGDRMSLQCSFHNVFVTFSLPTSWAPTNLQLAVEETLVYGHTVTSTKCPHQVVYAVCKFRFHQFRVCPVPHISVWHHILRFSSIILPYSDLYIQVSWKVSVCVHFVNIGDILCFIMLYVYTMWAKCRICELNKLIRYYSNTASCPNSYLTLGQIIDL